MESKNKGKRIAVSAKTLKAWKDSYIDGDIMKIVRKTKLGYSTVQAAFKGIATEKVTNTINSYFSNRTKKQAA